MKTAIRQAVDAGDDVLFHHYKKHAIEEFAIEI